MNGVLSLLVALALSGPAQSPGPQVGAIMPSANLPDLGGRMVSVRSARPEVSVVAFVAFWCDTWKEAMPHLRDLARLEREDGFRLAMVSVDGTRRDQFTRLCKPPPSFPVLLDIGGDLTQGLGVRRVPTVLVVDSEGVIRRVFEGYPANQAILAAVRLCQNRRAVPK